MKKNAILILLIFALLAAPSIKVHSQDATDSTTNYNVESKLVYVGWETIAHIYTSDLNNTKLSSTESDHSFNVTLNITRELNITSILRIIIPINITVRYPTEVAEGENISIKLYVDVGKANLTWILVGYVNTTIEYKFSLNYTDRDSMDYSAADESSNENSSEENTTSATYPTSIDGYIKYYADINATLNFKLDEPVGVGLTKLKFEDDNATDLVKSAVEFYMKALDENGTKMLENLMTIPAEVDQKFELTFRYNTSLNLGATVFVGNETVRNLTEQLENDDNYFEIEIPTEGISGTVGLNLTLLYNVYDLSIVISKLGFETDMDDLEFVGELEKSKDVLGSAEDDLKMLSHMFEKTIEPENVEKEEEKEIEEEHEEHEKEEEHEEESVSAQELIIAQESTIVSSAPTDRYDIVITTYVDVARRTVLLPGGIQINQTIPIIAVLASLSAAIYVVVRRNSKK